MSQFGLGQKDEDVQISADETTFGIGNGVDGSRSDEGCNGDVGISQVLTSVELAQFVDSNQLKYLNSNTRQHPLCCCRAS